MKRNFKYPTLSMLVAALTVAENFSSFKADFINEKPQWDDPYIIDFIAKIESIMNEYFGINSKAELKNATRLVKSIQAEAIDHLGMIKQQITRGFRKNKERRDVLLEQLGFIEFWRKASKKNQTMLIGMLIAFTNNNDETVRAELVANGVNAGRISAVTGYTDSFKKANTAQENLKATSKLNTEVAVNAFNEIFDQAMDICFEAKGLFKKDKIKKSMFAFGKLVKNQGAAKSETGKTAAEGSSNEAAAK